MPRADKNINNTVNKNINNTVNRLFKAKIGNVRKKQTNLPTGEPVDKLPDLPLSEQTYRNDTRESKRKNDKPGINEWHPISMGPARDDHIPREREERTEKS